LRTAPKREELVVYFGGNKRSEAAVAAGLNWLARHQAEDGSWCNRYLGDNPVSVCERERKCQSPGDNFAFAQTGLAVLAFQAGGHYAFNEHEFSAHVRRGLDWLAKRQNRKGSLYSAVGNPFMYEHGIAAFALAEACALAHAEKREPDPRHHASREKGGGVNRSPATPGRRLALHGKPPRTKRHLGLWLAVLALKSAREAGIPVSDGCVRQVEVFFKRCETGQSGRTGYTGPAPTTDATTGVGMLVHQFLLGDPECGLVQQATPYWQG